MTSKKRCDSGGAMEKHLVAHRFWEVNIHFLLEVFVNYLWNIWRGIYLCLVGWFSFDIGLISFKHWKFIRDWCEVPQEGWVFFFLQLWKSFFIRFRKTFSVIFFLKFLSLQKTVFVSLLWKKFSVNLYKTFFIIKEVFCKNCFS